MALGLFLALSWDNFITVLSSKHLKILMLRKLIDSVYLKMPCSVNHFYRFFLQRIFTNSNSTFPWIFLNIAKYMNIAIWDLVKNIFGKKYTNHMPYYGGIFKSSWKKMHLHLTPSFLSIVRLSFLAFWIQNSFPKLENFDFALDLLSYLGGPQSSLYLGLLSPPVCWNPRSYFSDFSPIY